MAIRTPHLLASALGLSAALGIGLLACGGSSSSVGVASSDGGSEGSATTEAGSGVDSGSSSDGSTDGGAVTDGSMADDASDAGDMTDGGDAGQCNTLKPPMVDIAVTFGGEPPPAPLGGAIAPGTYKLSAVVLYGATADSGVPDAGATSILERGEIVLGATTYDTVTIVTAAMAAQTRRDGSGTYAVAASGKDIDFTEACPSAATTKAGYTVEGGNITIYRPETFGGQDYIAGMTYGP